jgi:hypothetical protein
MEHERSMSNDQLVTVLEVFHNTFNDREVDDRDGVLRQECRSAFFALQELESRNHRRQRFDHLTTDQLRTAFHIAHHMIYILLQMRIAKDRKMASWVFHWMEQLVKVERGRK